jgi:hypothetical protein
MAQVFVGRNAVVKDEAAFERKLYVIRKVAEQTIRYGNKIPGGKWFYVSSLSARTLTYKGMLMSEQVEKYYDDLRESRRRHGDRARPFAFFHQHVPELGPRASEPLHRAQRRDQHAARQCQLDEGAAGAVQPASFSATK